MVLINCRECGNGVSDEVYPCPRCGTQYPELADPFSKRLAQEFAQKSPGPVARIEHNGKIFTGWRVRSLEGTRRLDGNPGQGWWEEYNVTRDLIITVEHEVLVLEKHWYEGSDHNGQGDVSMNANPMPLDHDGRAQLRRIVRGY